MDSTQIVQRSDTVPDVKAVEGVAQQFIKSGFFTDARDTAKAVTKIMIGSSLGLDPFASMTQIYLVQGKLQMGAHLVGRLIKSFREDGRRKYRYELVESTNDICTIQLWERVDTGPASWEWKAHKPFTRKRDEYKHLHNNPTWKNNGRDMLYCRTITSLGRMLCPEVMGGAVYSPDEIPGTEDNIDLVTLGPKHSDIPSRAGSQPMTLAEAEQTIEAEFETLVEPTKHLELYQRIIGGKNNLPTSWILRCGAGLTSMAGWDLMTPAQLKRVTSEIEVYEDLHG